MKNVTAFTINHVKKRNSPYVSCQSRPNLTLLTMNKQTNHSLLRTSRNVIEMTRLMSQFHTVAVAIARPLTATGKISDKISHVPIHKITLEGLKSPTHNIFPTSKVEFGSFRPKCFQFLGHFRQLLWHNRLDIDRSTTTGSGRLYGSRIILVCNAYAVTIFWLYFLVFGLF